MRELQLPPGGVDLLSGDLVPVRAVLGAATSLVDADVALANRGRVDPVHNVPVDEHILVIRNSDGTLSWPTFVRRTHAHSGDTPVLELWVNEPVDEVRRYRERRIEDQRIADLAEHLGAFTSAFDGVGRWQTPSGRERYMKIARDLIDSDSDFESVEVELND